MNGCHIFRDSAAGLAFVLLIAAAGCARPQLAPKEPDNYVEIRFLIPIVDNQGTPFEENRFQWMEEEMAKKFGGYTYEGQFKGAYYDGKRIMNETSRRYVIAVRRSRLVEIKNFLLKVKKDFSQKSLYLSISKDEVVFL